MMNQLLVFGVASDRLPAQGHVVACNLWGSSDSRRKWRIPALAENSRQGVVVQPRPQARQDPETFPPVSGSLLRLTSPPWTTFEILDVLSSGLQPHCRESPFVLLAYDLFVRADSGTNLESISRISLPSDPRALRSSRLRGSRSSLSFAGASARPSSRRSSPFPSFPNPAALHHPHSRLPFPVS